MTATEWLTCVRPWEMLGFLRSRSGRASLRARLGRERLERKQRLFLVACCRRIWSSLGDERSRRAVEVAERFADGVADEAELRVVYDAAASAYAEVRRTPDARAYCAACPAAEVARFDFRGGFDICTYGADVAAMVPAARQGSPDTPAEYDQGICASEEAAQADLLRDIFGNPFKSVSIDPSWQTPRIVQLAQAIYDERTFDRMPLLADALERAGCSDAEIVGHCRQSAEHVRGCWVVDLILGKD